MTPGTPGPQSDEWSRLNVNDGITSGLTEKLGRLEERLRQTETELLIGRRLHALLLVPAWREMQADFVERLKVETEALLRMPHDAYDLGRRQGYIRAIRLLTPTKVPSEADLDRLEREALPLLREEIERLKNVLA